MTSASTAPTSIGHRIDAGYAALSRQEQRAADFILDHLGDLAVFTATELAQHSGVSKATVSRLFRRLGFSNSQEVREHARALRSSGVPVGPARGQGDPLTAHLESERANLARLAAAVGDGPLEEAVRLVAGAREVVVIGLRNSYPVALHLRQQLAQARGRVRIAPQPGQSLGEELAGLGAEDVVVLVGFRRRPASFAGLVETLGVRAVPVVLLADPPARRYAEQATVWLECPVESGTAFDSYAAAMSAVALLASGVLGASPRESRERIAGISTAYAELAELEERT
ncbi:MurR/RpiR family transcriptional regulator [Rathayibacter rathayi]|uniref:MurR/RpiR family transcriptional regulator n=1 Tax=Rathayibacter rathayi TaxID=33887 RepID=UPI000CE7B67D|nr:MurR/RpiR family transcriptional regulator [Rathayibacter rathayi]PPF25021.1 MurR/RpiR family transcriptional regulator [Rathayibacter rathayi]PPG71785.1 MurR/RpiR family transcriptional regulator [Rathayibacter rathayi]PPG79157.1 MurR/RpiR family transcriptional regulator [Rathayibacter rathayi]PPG97407.1 MurR/RpiR family transcriptional regulator [Rathayibacter rathayi]PPI71902.1 MurR/RpiR family transcriptional regulator [Rathayibacter rathayi]